MSNTALSTKVACTQRDALPKLSSSLASMVTHLENGQILGKSTQSDHQTIKGFTTLILDPGRNLKSSARTSSMLGFLQQNRKMILNDKRLVSLVSTQTTKLLQTSDPESTSRDPDFCPFFNNLNKDVYSELWLPQESDCVDSPLNLSIGSSEKTLQSLPFTSKKISLKNTNTNSQMTYFPLSKSFAVGETVEEGTNILRMRKVRIYPTLEQKKLLRKFSNHHRYTYNNTLESIKNKKSSLNFQENRNKFVTYESKDKNEYVSVTLKPLTKTENVNVKVNLKVFSKSIKESDKSVNPWFIGKEWLLETPKTIRADAVQQCISANKAANSNLKAGNITHFNLRFRSKKSLSWSIGIEKFVSMSKKDGFLTILSRSLGDIRYRDSKHPFEGEQKPKHDCKIHKDAYGRYFLLVPYEKHAKVKDNDTRPVVAIDPGVRTYMATYDNEGSSYLLLDGMSEKIFPILTKIDKLSSDISKCKEKEKEKLRKQKKNLLRKYNDLKSDTHHKLGTFLAKKYSVIVLPKFGSKEMVSKRVGRKLKTKTCRLMLSMAHGEFREKLLYKAQDHDTKVIVGNESYTTKTCGNCGIINEKVGGSKVFHCTHCGLRAHRDVHAARNILLKHLCVHR